MITLRISQQARLEISLAGVQASEPGRLAAFICDHNCEFLRFYLRSPGYNWLGSGCSQWLLIKSLRVESSAMDRELGPSVDDTFATFKNIIYIPNGRVCFDMLIFQF